MITNAVFKPALAFLLAAGCCIPAAAQVRDTTGAAAARLLSNVVVTGQYRPVKPEDAVQRIRVIDAKKIAAMGAQNLRDVLLNEMNVSIAQDNVLGSSVRIQGISGQNVKILIDGVPVIGRQDGNIDASQINVYNVERIELVEGPMSVNYGTDALAGTINIITKSTIKNKIDAGINTYTESIGKYNANANVGFNAGKHMILLSGARNFFDGWDKRDGFKYLDFAARAADETRSLQWDAKEEYNAGLQYAYKIGKVALRFKSDYYYDIITNRGAPLGYYGYNAFDDYYKTERFNNTLFLNSKVFKNKTVNFLAAYNRYKRLKNTYVKDLTTLDELIAAASDQDTSRYTLFNSRATIGSGSAYSKLGYELGYDINIENGYGKRILNTQQQIGDYAIYGSAEYKITDSFTARVGLRYAYNTAFESPLIPALNLKYILFKNLTLRASYARGFRAPNVKELYFEFKDSNHDIVGNANLTPEESNNFSIAALYSTRPAAVRYKIEVSAFYNSIRNMINLAQPDTSVMRYTYVNIDHFKTNGVQLNVSGEYKNFNATVGGSYIGRYNQLSEYEDPTSSSFTYSPELRCNLSYDLKKYNASFSLFTKYTGSMPTYGLDEKGNVILTTINAYSMADASASKKFLRERLVLSVGCKNIFNTTNINRIGPATAGTAHSTTTSSISIGTGRSYFVGVGYQFSK
jgi:outer membrane receptor for ferrienterochelin and colicins